MTDNNTGSETARTDAGEIRIVPLDQIDISPLNTRTDLDAGSHDTDLEALAASIAELGLLSPVVVRATASNRFEVVAGQRRVLACRTLGWVGIEARVRDMSDTESVAVSIVENIQRNDMDPMDKARAFSRLAESYGSPSAVASHTGASPTTVRRYLHLLDLPTELQHEVRTGGGPAGVGFMSKLASTFDDPEDMREVFDRVGSLSGGIAEEILSRADGDIGQVDELVRAALEGRFNLEMCGRTLLECPHLPDDIRAEVAVLLRSTAE